MNIVNDTYELYQNVFKCGVNLSRCEADEDAYYLQSISIAFCQTRTFWFEMKAIKRSMGLPEKAS